MALNNEFEKIYASSFFFNKKGVAKWPAQAINYTNKTQFLFRIEKGVLDINDPGVNEYFKPEDIRIPFRNIIYIGDSDTDIPCMKLVNTNGGHSIGVFNPETKGKEKVYKMINSNRIKYFASADYTENSQLDSLVKAIIDKTAAYEKLEKYYETDKKEAVEDASAKETLKTIAKTKEVESINNKSINDILDINDTSMDDNTYRNADGGLFSRILKIYSNDDRNDNEKE